MSRIPVQNKSYRSADRVSRELEHFDRLAEEMEGVWWGHKTPAGQTRLDYRGTLVEKCVQLGPEDVVLEPGAGNGEFSRRLAMTGTRIVALELSPKQARLGHARLVDKNNLHFVVGDVGRLPYPDNTFHAVIGCSVSHHFPMPDSLSEFVRVLRPGGRLLFSEPNMLNPQIALEKNILSIGRRLENSPDETAFFRWQVSKMLKQHHFTNVHVVPFDFLHPSTPEPCLSVAFRLSRFLEQIPILREIAGSLLIYGVLHKQ